MSASVLHLMAQLTEILMRLERLDVITTDPDDAEICCGLPRNEDGQCIYRPGHPIYVGLS